MLFADEPRWAPVLRPYEAWLFSRRHPYRQRAGVDVVRFLVRRGGHVVGRICAHHAAGSAEGWFGAFECADDPAAVRALVGAARDWVTARGATVLRGPATFTLADEAGVLADGFGWAGGTGRPWHPARYLEQLQAAGLVPSERTFPRWRLATEGAAAGDLVRGGPAPPQAGRLTDPRLVLQGPAGAVAAVPDVTAALRSTSLRRIPTPTEAAVARLEGDPGVLVPGLLAAAAGAGYRWVWSPWCPDPDRPPDAVHRLLTT